MSSAKQMARRALGISTREDQIIRLAERLPRYLETAPDGPRRRRVLELLGVAQARKDEAERAARMTDEQLYGVLADGIAAMPDNDREEFIEIVDNE